MYNFQKKAKEKKEEHIPVMREICFFALILFCAALLALCLISCNPVEQAYDHYNIPDDNFVEEIVESAIEYKTGVDLDLTPRSHEP